jgi:hypothetical protein
MNLNPSHVGHAHFWERAMTRRNFIGAAAVAGGAAATAGMWLPQFAKAAAFAEADPRFIPGGTKLPFAPDPFHFFFPTDGVPGAVTVESGHGDPSLITDFDGMIGVADVGKTSGTDGAGNHLLWKADVRFMKGSYVGTEGDTRTGAFAFI